MAKYQKYAEYKDSSVEWIGDIPDSWEVKPVFALFTPEMTKNIDGNETNVLSLSYGRIVQRDVENNHGLLPESFNTYQIVNDGDIILRLTDLQNDKRSLRVGLATQKGIITSAYLKLSALKEIDPKFAYRLLHSYDTTKVFYGMGGGLRQSMKFEDFRRLPILVPPKNDQVQIANFLDHETTQIDTLIAKQEKLIELLKEKRQAVISHAVTKGLNLNVPMKDSGVEWLGKVPEHWEIRRLKNIICSLESGCSVNAADIPAQSHELGVLKTSCVYTRSFRVEENKTVVPEDIQRVKCKVRKGSIIISRMNTPELVGASALVKVKADNIYLPDRLWQTIFFENIEIDAEYLSHFMTVQGFRDQIALGAEGASSSMQNIAKEDYLNINCLLPPLKEQILIREFIEQKLSILNHLNIKAQEVVDRLKERRTALISAAVTGKIDVRNWQHPDQNNNKHTELSA